MDSYRLLLTGLQALAAEGGRRIAQWACRRYFGTEAEIAPPAPRTPAERSVLGLAAELREHRTPEDGET